LFLADGLADSAPAQVTALSLLGLIVWWVLRRMDRTDQNRERDFHDKDEAIKEKNQEIAALEQKLETLREDNQEQHRVKHKALQRVSFLEGRASLLKRAARGCTCGSMDPVRVLLEEDL
jgi:hypothetical protein